MNETLNKGYPKSSTTLLISIGMGIAGILVEKTVKGLPDYSMGNNIAGISFPITVWLLVAWGFYVIAVSVGIAAIYWTGLTSDKHWVWKVPLFALLIVIFLGFATQVSYELHASDLWCATVLSLIFCP